MSDPERYSSSISRVLCRDIWSTVDNSAPDDARRDSPVSDHETAGTSALRLYCRRFPRCVTQAIRASEQNVIKGLSSRNTNWLEVHGDVSSIDLDALPRSVAPDNCGFVYR